MFPQYYDYSSKPGFIGVQEYQEELQNMHCVNNFNNNLSNYATTNNSLMSCGKDSYLNSYELSSRYQQPSYPFTNVGPPSTVPDNYLLYSQNCKEISTISNPGYEYNHHDYFYYSQRQLPTCLPPEGLKEFHDRNSHNAVHHCHKLLLNVPNDSYYTQMQLPYTCAGSEFSAIGSHPDESNAVLFDKFNQNETCEWIYANSPINSNGEAQLQVEKSLKSFVKNTTMSVSNVDVLSSDGSTSGNHQEEQLSLRKLLERSIDNPVSSKNFPASADDVSKALRNENRSNPRRGKKLIVLSDIQTQELEKHFRESQRLGRRCKSIAIEVGTTERQVRLWFLNRRLKEKELLEVTSDCPETSTGVCTSPTSNVLNSSSYYSYSSNESVGSKSSYSPNPSFLN